MTITFDARSGYDTEDESEEREGKLDEFERTLEGVVARLDEVSESLMRMERTNERIVDTLGLILQRFERDTASRIPKRHRSPSGDLSQRKKRASDEAACVL